MSLVVLLGNSNQIILIGDRRITVGPTPLSEEYNKVGVLSRTGLPLRLGFGLAGVAAVGNLNVRRLVLEKISESFRVPGQANVRPVEQLCRRLDESFRDSGLLRGMSRADKRLSVILAGYDYREDPPRLSYVFVSNFQNMESGDDQPIAGGFTHFSFREKRPCAVPISAVQRIGMWPALEEEDVRVLRRMLEETHSTRSIIACAAGIIRRAADRAAAHGLVGKQISWAVVPRDPTASPEFGYDSEVTVTRVPVGTAILDGWIIDGGFIGPSNGSAKPMSFGRVRKNAPCPCGSGRRFRRCHGSPATRRRCPIHPPDH